MTMKSSSVRAAATTRGVRDRAGHLVYRPWRSQGRHSPPAPCAAASDLGMTHIDTRPRCMAMAELVHRRRRSPGRRDDIFSGLEGFAEQNPPRGAALSPRAKRSFGAAEKTDRPSIVICCNWRGSLIRLMKTVARVRGTGPAPEKNPQLWASAISITTISMNCLAVARPRARLPVTRLLYHLQERGRSSTR